MPVEQLQSFLREARESGVFELYYRKVVKALLKTKTSAALGFLYRMWQAFSNQHFGRGRERPGTYLIQARLFCTKF